MVSIGIKSNGKEAANTIEILSVDLLREVNRIPTARLVLIEGRESPGEFKVSDSGVFAPGKKIEIELKYTDNPGSKAELFKGIVVGQSVELGQDGGMLLSVEIKDAGIKLTRGRNSSIGVKQKDSDVFRKLAQEAGLSVGTIEDTEIQHPQLVQYECTNWDFILTRADVLGLGVTLHNGRLSAQKLEPKQPPVLSCQLGIDGIFEFEMEINGSHQYSSLEAHSWKLKDQAVDKAKAPKVKLKQGDLDGEKVAGNLGFGPHIESHPAPVEHKEVEQWAQGRMQRNRLALLRGRVTIQGHGGLQLLDVVELSNIAAHFNGKALITGLRHHVSSGGWTTAIQFGLSPEPFARTADIASPAAAGLIPRAAGLQAGGVVARDDPDKLHRIKVKLPTLGDNAEVWARVASPYGGADRGWFFRPEVGDEVIIGFYNDDPRFPVILGSMYSPKSKPPAKGLPDDKDNKGKALVTKKGIVIGFVDDEKAQVFIETPKGRKILLDDDGEKIELTDPNKNTITMNKDGIVLKSCKDFKIDASGNVEIKGSKVDVK